MSNLNERLTELRKKQKTTAKELASILNVVYGTYWNWEAGINEPPLSKLIKIANYHNVTVDYLLGLTDIKNTASMEDCEMLKDATKEEMHTIKALLKLNSLQLGQVYGFIQGMLAKFHNF